MTYNSWVSTFMINEWSISIIISSKLMIQTTRWCPRLRHRKVGEHNQYVTWMYGNYNHGIVYWFMALITRVVVLVRRDTSIYPYIPSISQSDWWVYKPTNTTGGIWGWGTTKRTNQANQDHTAGADFAIFLCCRAVGCFHGQSWVFHSRWTHAQLPFKTALGNHLALHCKNQMISVFFSMLLGSGRLWTVFFFNNDGMEMGQNSNIVYIIFSSQHLRDMNRINMHKL